jgi:orotate phosphoribosyltransferase-like protein
MPGISKLRAHDLLSADAVNCQVPGLTDGEIAKRLGISRSRAYQLRLRALAKIREAFLTDPELRELAEEVCGRQIA